MHRVSGARDGASAFLRVDGVGGLDLHRNYPENWRGGVDSCELDLR